VQDATTGGGSAVLLLHSSRAVQGPRSGSAQKEAPVSLEVDGGLLVSRVMTLGRLPLGLPLPTLDHAPVALACLLDVGLLAAVPTSAGR